MSKINVEMIKDKYNCGVSTLTTAIEAAKEISLHPKLDASFTVKSKKDGIKYFDGSVHFDKKITLYRIFCVVLTVFAAFAAATVITNLVFSAFDGKKSKKCKSKISKEKATVEKN